MKKAGFRKKGERLKAQYHVGIMKERLEYAINKDEFMRWYTEMKEGLLYVYDDRIGTVRKYVCKN